MKWAKAIQRKTSKDCAFVVLYYFTIAILLRLSSCSITQRDQSWGRCPTVEPADPHICYLLHIYVGRSQDFCAFTLLQITWSHLYCAAQTSLDQTLRAMQPHWNNCEETAGHWIISRRLIWNNSNHSHFRVSLQLNKWIHQKHHDTEAEKKSYYKKKERGEFGARVSDS